MKLPLVYYGHPILRKKAKPVEVFDEKLLELIENMKETVQAFRGIGLSAPQVGVSQAILLTNMPLKDEELGYRPGVPQIYINPRIESVSEESWFEEEGCLSIPKIYIGVERPLRITLSAQNERGEWRTESLEGWRAKVLLHENDHLNGVLFIDRIVRRDRKRIEKELELIRKKFEQHNKTVPIIE